MEKQFDAGSERDSDRLAKLYGELRQIAHNLMKHHVPDSVLQPTALVNELCMKYCARSDLAGADRSEILIRSAAAMRNLLVDHIRRRRRAKRTPPGHEVPFEQVAIAYDNRSIDLLALDEALNKLAQFDPEGARVVDLRFFVGLSMEEIATCLGMPLRSLQRRWQSTSAWLQQELE